MDTDFICSVPGCDKPYIKKGMCNAHYLRMRRYGRTDPVRIDQSKNHCSKSWCPAAKKLHKQIHYLENRDAYIARARSQTESQYYKNQRSEYFSRPDVKERARKKTKEWAAQNPDRKRELDIKWRNENRAADRANKARYRAARRQATPPWLTDRHLAEIRCFYAKAERKTLATGIPHEVDHIIPLQGGIVCGLHVPWNLRVLTKDDNNRRPRLWSENQP